MAADPSIFDVAAKLREWARAKPNVVRLWLFGSHLRGTQTSESDLDVALEIEALPKHEDVFTTWMSEHSAWESELVDLVHHRVDLQHFDLDNANSAIVRYVSCCSMLIYARAA